MEVYYEREIGPDPTPAVTGMESIKAMRPAIHCREAGGGLNAQRW